MKHFLPKKQSHIREEFYAGGAWIDTEGLGLYDVWVIWCFYFSGHVYLAVCLQCKAGRKHTLLRQIACLQH